MRMKIHGVVIFQFFLSIYSWAEPFVIGDLMGQLGNQMFQIATATSLALDHGAVALFPALEMGEDYNLPLNREKVFPHLLAEPPQEPVSFYYIEPRFYYDPIPYTPNMLIRGWFQSEKYFRHHK